MGRPPVVLGLDFGGTKIAVAVCDVQGNRLASATVSTASPGAARIAEGADAADPAVTAGPSAASPGAASPGDASPGAEESPDGQDLAQVVFHRAIRAARGLLTTAAPDSELVAVGASTFGIPHEDKVELAPAIDGWENLALGRELRAAFPDAIIRMATDAKAAAAAEVRWGALHDCDPGMYLNLGTGLSAAIVAGGEVIVGGNGAAGEFGYNLRNVADVGLELSQRTMLEEMVSGLALARRAGGQPGRPPGVTAADVFKAGTGDPASAAWSTISPPSWRSTWSTWPSWSTRCGSRWAAAWSGPGTGSPRGWRARCKPGRPFRRSWWWGGFPMTLRCSARWPWPSTPPRAAAAHRWPWRPSMVRNSRKSPTLQ